MGWPSGTVTFLFTDIEGSTKLWDAAPRPMRAALERHDAIVRSAVDAHGGAVFSTGGDGFAAAFSSARQAVSAATEAQGALRAEAWPSDAPIRVRMGLHTGEAVERDGDYFGPPVNEAARLMGLGHGGQVLCSSATAALVGGEWALLDLGAHRLRDVAATRRVFQVGGGRFPPLRSAEARPTNLPAVTAGLIGRGDELGRLSSLLAVNPLVTLTGVGGTGKTRLALAAGAAVADRFVDGCWFAALAAVTTPGDVATAVSAAVQSPATDEASLVRYLAQRQLFLVLDNCEHMIDAAASLAGSIRALAPDVVVLATSREPLGVDGEAVYRVPALGVPEPDALADDAGDAPAVRLFVERAGTATVPFELTDGNVASVVSICRHLDGLPLAIELAAARARSMTAVEVAQRLGERFRLLRSDRRGAEERHRTLQATLAWSYELLGAEERRLFRNLSVFPASFDLIAAEAVGAEDGEDTVDLLLRLVDRSLVVYEPSDGRYRLLETLRQFGADRLDEVGETGVLRDRHADHYGRLAAGSGGGFRASVELDNLRTAADWLGRRGRWLDVVRLCGDLTALLNGSSELLAWSAQALDRAEGLSAQDRVDALGKLAYTAVMEMSDLGHAIDLAQESLELAESTDRLASPWAWMSLALAGFFTGGKVDSRHASQAALTAAHQRGDERARYTSLGMLASAIAIEGDLDGAVATAEEARGGARAAGDRFAIAVALICNAGLWTIARREPEFRASLDLLEANRVDIDDFEASVALWLHQIWGVAYLDDDPGEAVHHLTVSVVLADRIGVSSGIDQTARLLAIAHARGGRPALAAQIASYADAALAEFKTLNAIQEWIESQAGAILAGLEPAERSAALGAGLRLDRRGFIRLVTDAARAAPPGGWPGSGPTPAPGYTAS